MEVFKPPMELVFDQNMAERWKRWKKKFSIYMKASGKDKEKDEEVKIAILLNLMGDEGAEIYETLDITEKTLTAVLDKFETYCSPLKDLTMESHRFHNIVQKEGQSFEGFLTELKKQSKCCEFVCMNCSISYEERMIKDRVIQGVMEKGAQQRLLREPNITLEKAAALCRAEEASRINVALLDQPKIELSSIKAGKLPRKEENLSQSFKNQGKKNEYHCKKCGLKHVYAACPAFNKTCAKCQQCNHFARMCGNQGFEKPWRAGKKKTLSEVKVDPDDQSESELELYICALKTLNVGHVKQNNRSCEEVSWYESIRVNNKIVKFKLDTGAEVSVLPLNIFNKIDLKCSEVKKTNITLMSYGCPDFKLKPEGTTTLECISKKGKSAHIEFSIVKTEGPPLLGLNGCLKLELVKKIGNVTANKGPKTKRELIDKYLINFKGLGKFPGKQHIEIKEGAIPKVQRNRRIPVSLHSKLKSSLNELESKGIVSRVEGPSDWVNSLVVVEKPNGSLRLCLDPKPLNDVIKREHFMIPTAEDITSRLSGKSVFSVIDMKDGFWQVEIDGSSAKLCTFSTPFGRYQFHHLPFGICSSPEIFQKKNMELFGDIPGVEVYFDDIICAGASDEEHDLAVKGVMERAMKHNVKFNPDKFQYRLQEVKFMGQIISKEGLKADEGHVRAIVEMETPRNKSELMRILGMAKFLAKFVPKMSEVTAPLRDLTRNDVDWCWSKEQEKSLGKLKWYISNAPVLKFFDSSKPMEIQTDASKDGLGCCLMQDGHPVAYTSRSLTKCEQRYAQIEKELLSIVFSTEKFHQFIYGYKVTVITDHKPLEAIIEKNLDSVSARLQRMLLKLLKYKLHIKYLPGKFMFVADTLSRAYLKDEVKDDPEMEFVIHNIAKRLPISEKKKQEFQETTKQDEWLSQVVKYVESGWPERKVLPPELKHYWKLKQGINVVEGLVMFNEKIVVPAKLRREMLSLIHGSHCGVVKCKLRARQVLYWPNLAADIEKFVYQCRICEKFRKKIKNSL